MTAERVEQRAEDFADVIHIHASSRSRAAIQSSRSICNHPSIPVLFLPYVVVYLC
jgi:hypothetical protein